MERQVQRVGVGVGAFHNPPRAKYSEETRNLIKILMEESKLSMMQRKSIQGAVDRGESLPPPSRSASTTCTQNKRTTYPCYWKKRSQNVIASSGAYEREQYRRTGPLRQVHVAGLKVKFPFAANKEMQKRHLACMMAYGKDMLPTPRGPRSLHKPRAGCVFPDDVDPLGDLVQGIRERIEFLNDMDLLGQGKKYRPIINQEIAQKIRMLESLDRNKSEEIRKEVNHLKYTKPPPKPFPMGELEDV